MKIVVTGSLGHIGEPLARELAANGHAITVISSNPEKSKDITAIGATAAIGSLEDLDFLINTFANADAVFAMVPPNFGATDMRAYYQKLGNNYAQAIKQTGVQHVVYLSSYGAHLSKGTGLILGAYDVENILNNLENVAVTHLRPGYFYYNLNNFIGMIKQAGIIGANYGGDDKLIMVAPVDIAAVAAEELTTIATGKKIRYIVSEELTATEAAHILGVAINKPDLQWLTFTDEQTAEGMKNSGMPPFIIAPFVELGAAIHSGILAEDYEKNKPATFGKTKLTDYAKEFAAAF